MKEITYVTGNWAKVASAKQILEPLGFKINNVKMDHRHAHTKDNFALALLLYIRLL